MVLGLVVLKGCWMVVLLGYSWVEMMVWLEVV